MLPWAHRHGVALRLIGPGKLKRNVYAGSFIGRLRDECLNKRWLISINHARAMIRASACEFNEERPKKALGRLTPAIYAR